jgi:hypothetical protein
VLLTYFVHKAAHDHDAKAAQKLKASHMKVGERFPEQRGLVRRRLSMKVPYRVNEDFRILETNTQLNTTELIKFVVLQIQDRVLEKPKPALIEELRMLSAIST